MDTASAQTIASICPRCNTLGAHYCPSPARLAAEQLSKTA